MSGDSVIAFDRLTHWYGDRRALHDLTLSVPRGSIFALLGRNGAGKSTAIRCLLGFQSPTSGSASILGVASEGMDAAMRARIGYVAEGQRLVPWMKVREIVEFQRATHPAFDAARCEAFLNRLGLPAASRVKHSPTVSARSWRWRWHSRRGPRSSSSTIRRSVSTRSSAASSST